MSGHVNVFVNYPSPKNIGKKIMPHYLIVVKQHRPIGLHIVTSFTNYKIGSTNF